jgi:hypothetical protein
VEDFESLDYLNSDYEGIFDCDAAIDLLEDSEQSSTRRVHNYKLFRELWIWLDGANNFREIFVTL